MCFICEWNVLSVWVCTGYWTPMNDSTSLFTWVEEQVLQLLSAAVIQQSDLKNILYILKRISFHYKSNNSTNVLVNLLIFEKMQKVLLLISSLSIEIFMTLHVSSILCLLFINFINSTWLKAMWEVPTWPNTKKGIRGFRKKFLGYNLEG